jgi:hypothetical protein
MRVLKDLTALTTIDLRVDEIKDYVPEGEPDYTTRVRRAFNRSLSALIATATALSIAAVAAAPWFAVLLLILGFVLVLRVWIHRWWRRPTDSPFQQPPTAPRE